MFRIFMYVVAFSSLILVNANAAMQKIDVCKGVVLNFNNKSQNNWPLSAYAISSVEGSDLNFDFSKVESLNKNEKNFNVDYMCLSEQDNIHETLKCLGDFDSTYYTKVGGLWMVNDLFVKHSMFSSNRDVYVRLVQYNEKSNKFNQAIINYQSLANYYPGLKPVSFMLDSSNTGLQNYFCSLVQKKR